MTRVNWLILLLVTITISLSQQICFGGFPDTMKLSASDPSIINSSPTVLGKEYIMTINGTYSMWPSYIGYGVDAAYLYSVPEEEITSLRWPPQKFLNMTIYDLPYWTGTEKEIPPFEIPGLNYKFVSRQHLGFRYNGNWLPDVGFNSIAHNYQVRIIGDGKPIQFQILDSAFDIDVLKVIPRYEDNSGELTIILEEEPGLNICEFEMICEDNKVVGVRLSAALFEYINDETGLPVNNLNEGNVKKIGLSMDGNFICPDSIKCNQPISGDISWCMVFDISGSMADAYGNTFKIDALKSSASKFLDNFKANDEGMLITFNENVYLAQDWTSDEALLKQQISNLSPGGKTAYFDAGVLGIERTFPNSNPYKAVLLLSDGEDNSSQASEQQLIDLAASRNIKVFTVGVSLEPLATASMERIAKATGGKYYSANNPDAMDSVFASISRDFSEDDCCDIYFSLPDTLINVDKPYEVIVHIYTVNKDKIVITKSIKFTLPDKCDEEISTTIQEDGEHDNYSQIQGVEVAVFPNPMKNDSRITLKLDSQKFIKIELISARGEQVIVLAETSMSEGSHSYEINSQTLSSGSYFVRIGIDGRFQMLDKLIVIK